MFYSTPDEVAGCFAATFQSTWVPSSRALGDRLGALEAAEALAQGHAEALA